MMDLIQDERANLCKGGCQKQEAQSMEEKCNLWILGLAGRLRRLVGLLAQLSGLLLCCLGSGLGRPVGVLDRLIGTHASS